MWRADAYRPAFPVIIPYRKTTLIPTGEPGDASNLGLAFNAYYEYIGMQRYILELALHFRSARACRIYETELALEYAERDSRVAFPSPRSEDAEPVNAGPARPYNDRTIASHAGPYPIVAGFLSFSAPNQFHCVDRCRTLRITAIQIEWHLGMILQSGNDGKGVGTLVSAPFLVLGYILGMISTNHLVYRAYDILREV